MEDSVRIPFWKLQSIGNDFPLVHLADIDTILKPDAEAPAPDATPFLEQLSIAICDRRFGVGGDGLLSVGMEGDALRLRMFNPDGTEDFCGNGIRCAAIHAHGEGWVGDAFNVLHLDKSVAVKIADGLVTTILGPADYDPEKVPHTAFGQLFNTNIWSGMDAGQPMSLFGSALTTGSTHVIFPTIQLPDAESFASVSAKIEVAPLFPKRTSVIWSQELAADRLQILIWERGVGETLGCGTGASAAAADYLRRKGRGGTVFVSSKGGALRIRMDAWDAPIEVIGVAEQVYRGTFLFADAISAAPGK